MTTAVDTSVLLSVTKGEPDAERWIDLLATARADGDLIICDIVAAEFFAVLMNREKFETSLLGLGISFVPTSLDAAQLAGRVFKAYRQQGGPREHLVDFLIGAHATLQAERLAAIDRGYLRRYFPRLRLLKPA